MRNLSKLVLHVSTLVAFQATAHVEPGKHIGQTATGEACEIEAGVTYFENNAHHPLNERIKIKYNGAEFIVGHPPVVDAEQGLAYFNHDIFQGVLPTSTGAKALVLDMVHTQEFEGLVRFTFVETKWKTGEKTRIVCDKLVHQN